MLRFSFIAALNGRLIVAGKPSNVRRRWALPTALAVLALLACQVSVWAAGGRGGNTLGGSNSSRGNGSISAAKTNNVGGGSSSNNSGRGTIDSGIKLGDLNVEPRRTPREKPPVAPPVASSQPRRPRPDVGPAIDPSKLGDIKVVDAAKNGVKTNDNKPAKVDGSSTKRLDLDKLKPTHKLDSMLKPDYNNKLDLTAFGKNRHTGPLSKDYLKHTFDSKYCGPKGYPQFCKHPHWTGWVDWCFNSHGWHDPRPKYCQPCHFNPCGNWVYWNYPIWIGLPVVECGTFVDVEPIVLDAGLDLQLLAVRFVDNGHAEKNLGPRYRVWLRNNSSVDIAQPFNVTALAGLDARAAEGLPQAGLRINKIRAGELISVDLRLPMSAVEMSRDGQNGSLPFAMLHVMIDSQNELRELNERNNGVAILREKILPIDPALFDADLKAAAPGNSLNLAGEGFGPEAGKVTIKVNGTEMQGEIEGWYDLGARIKLPNVNFGDATEADVTVIRGDGAAATPLKIKLAAAGQSVSVDSSKVVVPAVLPE